METTPMRFGPFILDRQRMTLSRGELTQGTGGRGAALLATLVEANGEVVSKDALMEAAWPKMRRLPGRRIP